MNFRATICWLSALTLSSFAQADSVTFPSCAIQTSRREPLRVLHPGVLDLNANSLILEGCNISSIAYDILEKIPNIREINLKNNKIQHFAAGALDSAAQLKNLSLNNNRFLGKYLRPNLLHQCKRLEYLYLSGNDMTDTPSELLEGVPLYKLELISCMLHDIPLFLSRPAFPLLRQLNLSKNLIRRLSDPQALLSVKNVYLLDLSENLIELFHEDLFKETMQLAKLFLSNNKMNFLPEKLLQNKPYLDTIDLANNGLEYIPENSFDGTTPLELSLRNNRLTFLPDQFCSRLGHAGVRLNTFYFDHNPWQCQCLLDILLEVKILRIAYIHERYNGHEKVCVSKNFVCDRSSDENRLIYDNFY